MIFYYNKWTRKNDTPKQWLWECCNILRVPKHFQSLHRLPKEKQTPSTSLLLLYLASFHNGYGGAIPPLHRLTIHTHTHTPSLPLLFPFFYLFFIFLSTLGSQLPLSYSKWHLPLARSFFFSSYPYPLNYHSGPSYM